MTTPAIVRTAAALAVFTAFGASPCPAQTPVTSIDELRRALAAGDIVTVVAASGPPVKGRVVRLGATDLGIRPEKGSPDRGVRDISVRFDAIQSLRRPRDSAKNGAIRGAVIGAGVTGALFGYALAVDRNEIDEWGPIYAGFAGVATGIGALVGWAVDAARSKPDIRFDASAGKPSNVTVRPIIPRGGGIGLAVSVSR